MILAESMNHIFDSNWLLQYKNSKEKLIKTFFIVYILVLVGLSRLILEVMFYIDLNGKWYSFDGDIVFVMSVYPLYLCFFLSMCAHLILRLFKVKADFKKLILLFFLFQFFHLIIPLFDYVGFEFGIPWTFQPYLNFGCCRLNPFSHTTNILQAIILLTPLVIFFTHPVLITMGINITWILVGFIFLRHLTKELKVSILKGILITLILFQITYWPIYRYFFVFDKLFRAVTGIKYYNHYGYGMYFLVFGTVGFIYFLCHNRHREESI